VNELGTWCQGEVNAEKKKDGRCVMVTKKGTFIIGNFTNDIGNGPTLNIDNKGVLQRAELWNDTPVGRRTDTDLEGISRTCEYPDERAMGTK
jgi:hypothetical protein